MKKLTNYASKAAAPLILAAMITTLTAPEAMAQAGSQPALVRDADNPARHPFTFRSVQNWVGTAQDVAFSLGVPAGKRLVIEQMAFRAKVKPSAGQKVSALIGTTITNGFESEYYFAGASRGPEGTFDEFIGSAQMRSYADGTVAILVHRANTTGTADSADVSVSGYLIDLP